MDPSPKNMPAPKYPTYPTLHYHILPCVTLLPTPLPYPSLPSTQLSALLLPYPSAPYPKLPYPTLP